VPDETAESILAALTAEARRRFGPDRATALASDLDALARDLARVALTPVPPEVEPGLAPGSEPEEADLPPGGDPGPGAT
jgi:hypothetical protein